MKRVIGFGPKLAMVMLASLLAVLPVPAGADEPPGTISTAETPLAGKPPWQVALIKTMTYRIIASVDLVVGGYLLTGSEIETAGIVAVVAGAKSLNYYVHELLWSYYAPPTDQVTPVDRSLSKSVTYRIMSMTTVFGLSMMFTDSITFSSAAVLVDAVYSIGVYFLHEMVWNQYLYPSQVAQLKAGAAQTLQKN